MNENDTTSDLDAVLRTVGTIGSPYIMLATVAFYLYVVLKAGPQFMSKRKPYDLKPAIMAYNKLQILYNIYILYLVYKILNNHVFTFSCQPISTALNEHNTERFRHIQDWVFYTYIGKLVDLIDTVFFVLRKKQSQVTFLHLFHHTTVAVSFWLTIFIAKEEVGIHLSALNNLIHVIMYSYYFLSGLGPSVQKYLGWKKYLTLIQISQFVYGFIHVNFLRISYGCKYHYSSDIVWNVNGIMFILLFVNFYRHSYNKEKTKAS